MFVNLHTAQLLTTPYKNILGFSKLLCWTPRLALAQLNQPRPSNHLRQVYFRTVSETRDHTEKLLTTKSYMMIDPKLFVFISGSGEWLQRLYYHERSRRRLCEHLWIKKLWILQMEYLPTETEINIEANFCDVLRLWNSGNTSFFLFFTEKTNYDF